MSFFYMAVAVAVAVRGRKRHPFVHRYIEKNGHSSSSSRHLQRRRRRKRRRVPQHFVNPVQRRRWRRRPHLLHTSCAVTPCPPPPSSSPLPFPSCRRILLNKIKHVPLLLRVVTSILVLFVVLFVIILPCYKVLEINNKTQVIR